MSHTSAPAALDVAVEAAQTAQRAALQVSQTACGLMYPFGTNGFALCPVCEDRVYMHLGFPGQSR